MTGKHKLSSILFISLIFPLTFKFRVHILLDDNILNSGISGGDEKLAIDLKKCKTVEITLQIFNKNYCEKQKGSHRMLYISIQYIYH